MPPNATVIAAGRNARIAADAVIAATAVNPVTVTESFTPVEEQVNQSAVVMQQQDLGLPTKEVAFLQNLINSKQLPGHIKTIADAITIGKMGRELGFPVMQAFHYIIPIQGKLTLSARAINAILRKNRVRIETIEDGVYVYRDGTTTEYPRPVSTPPLAGEEKPVDRRTKLKFERTHSDGTIEIENVTFTWLDATNQGLVTKDNWKRMPKEMLYARCLSKGANRIGADFMMGLYSADEIFDTVNDPKLIATRDEEGFVNNVITPHQNVPTEPTMVATQATV